ncbi:MAG: hypothetical protein PHV95_00485 [Eubacteriales bacterium]|nr:hypothetical protein [Eubacteriales bacterium]
MSDQRKLNIEEEIKNSGLSDNLQKSHIELCRFLEDNEFLIEPEDDGNGWKILFMNKCVGHMNFTNVGIWVDTCDFGESGSVDDVLKETAWAHVRICEHFSSDGKQCGCGRQPGFSKMLFGREHNNLCFAHLEFMNPDVETLENIKKLMLLFKQNKSNMQCS